MNTGFLLDLSNLRKIRLYELHADITDVTFFFLVYLLSCWQAILRFLEL